jgi:hypothetical protein
MLPVNHAPRHGENMTMIDDASARRMYTLHEKEITAERFLARRRQPLAR